MLKVVHTIYTKLGTLTLSFISHFSS